MAVFTGAGVAIVTPFHEDGSVNYDKFAEIIEEQIAGGTDAIIVCGTTGESACLSEEEHVDVVKFCIERVNHRIPVVAGTGSNCTDTAVHLSQDAENYGADAVLTVSPYYNKATQNGLFAHYKKIADSIKIPMILYNVPSRTGCNIAPETVVRLCTEVSNVAGVKEASGNIGQVVKLMSMADGKVDLYSGNDDQIVSLLSVGGLGVISVLSNVAPKQTHDICQKFFDGDVKGAAAAQLEAIPLIDALFCEVNPIPVKTALNLMGREVGPLRMPLSPMEPQNVEKLKKAMTAYGIL